MKFIEVVDGFSIRIDSIVSINRVEHNKCMIETENREYEVYADFNKLVSAIEEMDKPEPVQGITSQYFSV